MKVYLAGPMRGIPDFNFPAFHAAAARLRQAGFTVFSPAERDEELYGTVMLKTATGSEAEAADKGFSIREALAADCAWICAESEGCVLLPGWERSRGARTEKLLHEALGLKIMYYAHYPYADAIEETT
jgi:hypothetical protein